MYRVDKDHTPASRVNEMYLVLKDFRTCFTKNDLARMFYEEYDEVFNGKVLDIEVYGMPMFNGYAFCVDMTIENSVNFEKIHFWIDNEEENVYSITKDKTLKNREIYVLNTKKSI